MSDTDETALENLHRVRRHYADKKQEAMDEEDEMAAAYHSGQISGLTHAIEVLKEPLDEASGPQEVSAPNHGGEDGV